MFFPTGEKGEKKGCTHPTQTDSCWQLLKLNIVISVRVSAALQLLLNTISLTWVCSSQAASVGESTASFGDGSPWAEGTGEVTHTCMYISCAGIRHDELSLHNYLCSGSQQKQSMIYLFIYFIYIYFCDQLQRRKWTFRENLCHHPTHQRCFKTTALH